MSSALTGQVWRSSLPRETKYVALFLAHLAHKDGTGIFPSVSKMSERTGLSKRSVQVRRAELRKAGIIVPVANSKGGRNQFVIYTFDPSKLPSGLKQKSNGQDKTVTPTSPLLSKTMTPAAPLSSETAKSVAPISSTNGSPSLAGSCDYADTIYKHSVEGSYLKEGTNTNAAVRNPSAAPEEEDHLNRTVPTVRWLKDTWRKANSKSHRKLRLPTSLIPGLLSAESRFGAPDFRTAWLSFLGSGSFNVRQFLQSLGINSRSSGDSRAGFIRAAPNPSTAVPAGTRGSHNRPRRMTENEINQRVLARIKERRATETKKDSQ